VLLFDDVEFYNCNNYGHINTKCSTRNITTNPQIKQTQEDKNI